jgi:hypothetical protein
MVLTNVEDCVIFSVVPVVVLTMQYHCTSRNNRTIVQTLLQQYRDKTTCNSSTSPKKKRVLKRSVHKAHLSTHRFAYSGRSSVVVSTCQLRFPLIAVQFESRMGSEEGDPSFVWIGRSARVSTRLGILVFGV